MIGKLISRGRLHVLVDPGLGRFLRPHQVEGVKFMYHSIMGFKTKNHFGCILADDMYEALYYFWR